MKISIKNIIVLLALLFVSIKLHHKELNEFPRHIHAWAQSDYYAISLGFIDNGFNFFKPQTFVQNPQFPDYFKTPKKNSITAADFPVHTYLPAILMKYVGSEDPWVFRSYTLFFSIVGLFALFLLIKEMNGSDVKAVFGVTLVLLSPVYLYYRAGFLPSIPSLSAVIIAYYFYFKYLKSNRFKFFNWAILFFTFAALSRTPFAIFLIASLCQEGLTIIKKRKLNFRIITPYIVSFSIIIGYFIYNSILREKYGSIFLSKPLPPTSWENTKELFSLSLENWKYHYLTKWHYLFILVTLLLSILQYIRTRELHETQKKIFIQLSIALSGAIIYSFLMLQQFVAHDYYFIDTFFTPFILFIVFSLTYIKFNNLYLNLIAFALLIFTLYNMNNNALDAQVQRHETGAWDKTLFTIQNYENGNKLLQELKIPKDAKLLVLDSEAPNIPFILLRRYGFTIHKLTKENIIDKMNWEYDYIIAQNANIQNILSDIYPELSHKIERVGGNKSFSIYKKATIKKERSIDELLQLNTQKTFYNNSVLLDTIWNNNQINIDSNIIILPQDQFGLTLEVTDTKELIDTVRLVKVTLDATKEIKKNGSKLIFAITVNQKTVFYQDRTILDGKNSYVFSTTPIKSQKNKITLYIWNPDKETIVVSDFKIEMY